MPDIVDQKTRSRMMSGIGGKNTRPEMQIRQGLHALGFRYRLHAKDVPGKPDLVLPKYHAAIFVNGCFWHGHDCPAFRLPATRPEFWKAKIDSKRQRDRTVRHRLTEGGWRHLTVWECALRGKARLGAAATVEMVASWLRGDEPTGEIGAGS